MELKLDSRNVGKERSDLLIVPYGIEIVHILKFRILFGSFNRTLWN